MSLIHSHLNYCNLIWGAADDSILDPLFKLQKKAVRIISNSHYLDHTPPIFKSLKILNIFKIHIFNCSLFMFKCLKGNTFPLFRNRITQNLDIHNHNTRIKAKYRYKGKLRLKITQKSFINKGISLWNTLKDELLDMNILLRFKKSLKDHLIDL